MKRITDRRQLLQMGIATIASVVALSGKSIGASSARTLDWADLSPTGEAVLLPPVVHSGPGAGQNTSAFKVVEELNEQLVRIPGFIVPLEFQDLNVVEFILAPYKGACIHVPAPPPNQLVHVVTDDPYPSAKLIRPVWVTGILQVATTQTSIADAGYKMTANRIDYFVRG